MTVIVFLLLRDGSLGDVLGSLNTTFGLLLYAGLWAATCYTTGKAVFDYVVEQNIDRAFGIGLVEGKLVGQRFNKFSLGHMSPLAVPNFRDRTVELRLPLSQRKPQCPPPTNL